MLDLIHGSYEYIPARPDYILQLHRDLLRYTGYSYGGSFKSAPNKIGTVLPGGETVTLFAPLEPHEVPGAMEQLCEAYNTAIAEGAGARSTSYDIVRRYALGKAGTFAKRDALEACPSLGSSSVESALKKLVDDGTLRRIGAGRKTRYVRSDSIGSVDQS